MNLEAEGKRFITDGPFAETREQVGGYFFIHADDLDEAIDVAGRIPGARLGTVEIRAIIELTQNQRDNMAKTDFKAVDEYIQTFPPDVQEVLTQIRQTLRAAVPEAEETISYQVPAYKYHGWVFYFSAHKKHFSLACPPPFTVFEKFKEELSPYKIAKSSIKFPLDQPVPVTLIRQMAEFRAQENLATAKTKKK